MLNTIKSDEIICWSQVPSDGLSDGSTHDSDLHRWGHVGHDIWSESVSTTSLNHHLYSIICQLLSTYIFILNYFNMCRSGFRWFTVTYISIWSVKLLTDLISCDLLWWSDKIIRTASGWDMSSSLPRIGCCITTEPSHKIFNDTIGQSI